MDEDFLKVAKHFNAEKSLVHVPGTDANLKMAVLASWQVGLVWL